LIKSSPLPLEEFMEAKFLLGFIPLFFLGEFLVVTSSLILHWPPVFILASAVTMLPMSYGITSLCLILGMRQADFSIREPLDFALSYKGFFCLVWELVFIGIVLALAGIPTFFYLDHGLSRSFIFSLGVSLMIAFVILFSLRRAYKASIVKLYENPIFGA
jgi:hypothetical protein